MLGERVCLPGALHPTVSQVAHGHIHIQNGHASAHKPPVVCPGITTPVTRLVKAFIVCARHNPGKVVKTPQKVTLKLLYPFQRLQMEFIQLPKNGT
ncbi:hypothetical protein GDO81_027482 [Engystomops pustulosus]|uniref:Uncharacterized protein n=1 Tax=Engystomops pustulosus TaxID=76066 RepID=A0AAV6YEF0_ENGPU|nr:hypothetical protein GDO81_027482 [Engystomops pustulosus]